MFVVINLLAIKQKTFWDMQLWNKLTNNPLYSPSAWRLDFKHEKSRRCFPITLHCCVLPLIFILNYFHFLEASNFCNYPRSLFSTWTIFILNGCAQNFEIQIAAKPKTASQRGIMLDNGISTFCKCSRRTWHIDVFFNLFNKITKCLNIS